MRHSTRLIALLWTLTAASLAGCPSPPEAKPQGGGQAMGGPPPGGPPGGQAGGPPPGGPPAGGDAAGAPPAPAEGAKSGGPVTPGAGGDNLSVPSFKDLITGDTITLTVNVKGGKKGQVDFMIAGDNPNAIHVEPFEGEGPFEINAPATLDDEIHVVAINFSNGDSIGEEDELGAPAKPIKLDGSDLTIDIKMGGKPTWLEPIDGNQAHPPKPPPPPASSGPASAPGPNGTPPPGGDAGAPPPGSDAGAPPPGGEAGAPPPGGDAGAPPPGGDAGAAPQ